MEKQYMVLEHAYCYGIFLSLARRFTEEEKPEYSEWDREHAFVGLEKSDKLQYITWDDLPDRPSDGSFLGCSNRAWIITQEEWDRYIELNAEREKAKKDAESAAKAEYEAKIAAFESKKEERVSKLDFWETTDEVITDEGGKTHCYHHCLSYNGKKYAFVERYVFDFGRVINPCYGIAPGHDPGGLANFKDEEWWWMDFCEKGWKLIRKMEPEEAYCFDIVREYGKFAKCHIRM